MYRHMEPHSHIQIHAHGTPSNFETAASVPAASATSCHRLVGGYRTSLYTRYMRACMRQWRHCLTAARSCFWPLFSAVRTSPRKACETAGNTPYREPGQVHPGPYGSLFPAADRPCCHRGRLRSARRNRVSVSMHSCAREDAPRERHRAPASSLRRAARLSMQPTPGFPRSSPSS